MAFLRFVIGEREAAARDLTALATEHFTELPRDGNWLPAMVNLAEVAHGVGDAGAAQDLYELLRPHAASAVVVAAAQDAGVNRYFAMSAGMVALDWPLFKYVLRPLIFRHILAEHRRVEDIVRASTLEWTIVRPSALTNHLAQGYDASLELKPRAFTTSRADVAAFIADDLDNNVYVRQAVFVTSHRTK